MRPPLLPALGRQDADVVVLCAGLQGKVLRVLVCAGHTAPGPGRLEGRSGSAARAPL